MAHKILVVDDEQTLRSTVRAYLEAEGYEVRTAAQGDTALDLFRTFEPDLVVLDVMLPVLDGLEVLRQIRKVSDAYVILLTARSDEMDKVVGLTLGADDYVSKPFSPRELQARVRAALRRLSGGNGQTQPVQLVAQRLRLDPQTREVWKDDAVLDLTRIEFDLLYTLMRHPGHVLSREQLLEQVWQHDYYGDDRLVDVHVSRLRRKIEDDPANPTLIITVWGVGYRFRDEE